MISLFSFNVFNYFDLDGYENNFFTLLFVVGHISHRCRSKILRKENNGGQKGLYKLLTFEGRLYVFCSFEDDVLNA